MGKAPKSKVTADAGAATPAEAKTGAAPILSEGDGSSAGAGIAQAEGEGDAALAQGAAEGEVETSPVTEATAPKAADAAKDDRSLPDDAGADVLALVLSPILLDGAMLQLDETVLLAPDDFAKLAAAGAVTRAEVE